jgi:hypothetical protein
MQKGFLMQGGFMNKKSLYLVCIMILIAPYLNAFLSSFLVACFVYLYFKVHEDTYEEIKPKQKRKVTPEQYESYSSDNKLSIDSKDMLDSVDSDWMEVTQIPK